MNNAQTVTEKIYGSGWPATPRTRGAAHPHFLSKKRRMRPNFVADYQRNFCKTQKSIIFYHCVAFRRRERGWVALRACSLWQQKDSHRLETWIRAVWGFFVFCATPREQPTSPQYCTRKILGIADAGRLFCSLRVLDGRGLPDSPIAKGTCFGRRERNGRIAISSSLLVS
jgi:hypothetical protein